MSETAGRGSGIETDFVLDVNAKRSNCAFEFHATTPDIRVWRLFQPDIRVLGNRHSRLCSRRLID